MESGLKTDADVKKATLQAQEKLWEAYGKAYATYADPKYKEAQDKAAEEIKKLGGEVKANADAQAAAKEAAKEQADAAKKLKDAQDKLAEAQAKLTAAYESGNLKDIFKAQNNVEKANQNLQFLQGGSVDPKQPGINVPVNISYTQGNMQAFIDELKKELADTDVDQFAFDKITEQLRDSSAIADIMSTAIQNGIDTSSFDASGLINRILGGEDILNSEIQDFVKQLNEKLKEKLGDKTITFKFDVDTNSLTKATDEIVKNAQKVATAWNYAGTIAGNLEKVFKDLGEDDAAAVMTVIKAIATIAYSFSQAAVQAAEMGPWAWLAYMAAGTGALATAITTVHTLTGYANGGIIPGNSMSGDNMRGMTPDGTVYGLNAGEVVLNRSQVGNLASQLEGGAQFNMSGQSYISGEDIYIAVSNYGKRTGQGELIFG
jgi:hypothetical protein